jgi:hypothetical protein
MDILGLLLKNRLVRGLAAGKGYSEDILEILKAATSVGQPADPAFPSEMFPMGAKLYGRGMFTLLAVQPNPDWVWPFFIVRQFDPRHPDFVGRGHSIMALNTTHRNWTAVGCIGSEREAVVDPRGLATPRLDGWSSDVWLLEGDKLTAPSRLDSVRQYSVARLPIVRTIFASAAHEVQSEVFAARVARRDAVLQKVTVKNTGGPKKKASLIFSLRPYNPEGLSVVREVGAGPRGFTANKKAAVVFMSEPDNVDCSNEADGDVSLTLAERRGRLSAKCRVGLATAAAEYALELEPGAEAIFWFVMPMADKDAYDGWPDAVLKTDPDKIYEQLYKEWTERLAETIGIEVPDERLQRAFDVNKAYLLLLWDGDAICPGPLTYHHFWFRDAAYQVSSLDKMGFHKEAAQVLDSYPGRQRKDGFFISQNGEWDANGQAMWALYEHYKYTGDKHFLETVYPAMIKGVDWIKQKRMSTTSDRNSEVYGLLPAGFSAEHFGPNDYYYWDDYWCFAGVRAAEYAAAELGKPDAQKDFHQEADRFLGHIEASLAGVERKLGKPLIPASPYRRMNSGAIGALCAIYPLNIYPPDDERMINTMDEIRRISFFENGFFQNIHHSGVNAYLTFQFAQCLLRRRDPEAWTLLRYILDLASPTFTWPEAAHTRTRGGVMGDGHHGWAVADFLHLVRNTLLLEDDENLVVFPLVPDEWVADGKKISIREAPSYFGKVNAAMAVDKGRARIEFDNHWRRTPEKLIVCFPRKISTVKIDGADDTIQFADRVELSPSAKTVEVTFA